VREIGQENNEERTKKKMSENADVWSDLSTADNRGNVYSWPNPRVFSTAKASFDSRISNEGYAGKSSLLKQV